MSLDDSQMDAYSDEWVELQTYASLDEASPLLELLSENHLTYNTVTDEHRAGDGLNFDLENRGPGVVHVLVMPRDLDQAQRVLQVLAGEVQSEIEEGDYLASFSDEELYDVLRKFDEWNQIDYVLAARLLAQRGHQLNEDTLRQWRAERMCELEKPEKASPGFLAGTFVMALLGGIFGFLMGLQLYTHVKRLPDGRKVHGYSESDRRHGVMAMGLALVVMFVMACLLFSMRR